jgi:hypothetical protein
MIRSHQGLAALFAVCTFVAPAFAQSKGKGGGGVIVVRETTVVGRVQKPVAAQEIGKLPTRLQSSEPKKSFLDRIEGATATAPF